VIPQPIRTARGRALTFLLTLLAIGLLAVRSGQRVTPINNAKVSDITTYHRMIDRLRAGTPYYDAIGSELRRWGYATREVFNWRTPLLMTFEAQVSNATAQRLLVILAALVCAGTFAVVSGWTRVAITVLMQLGMVALYAGSDAYVMSEPWAGVLIALSICAFSMQRRRAGVALGLLALFVRELAAPYCVVCTLMAWRQRRRAELTAWIAGGLFYFGYYAWHLSHVLAHRLPNDISHPSSWLTFGGLSSVVTRIYWHGWLVLLPMWVTAPALVLIVAGLADTQSDDRARITSAAYLLFFLVAGQSFDWYWGLVAWPTWAFVFAGGPRAITNAVRALANDSHASLETSGHGSR
jgi:hypothetical protein